MPAPPEASFDHRRSWFLELGLMLLATGWGTFLRLQGVGQVALSHFDEGVYASNIWFGPSTNFGYPARHLYAPPLLPALIELSFTLFGPGDWQALLPGLISGCLLVPLIWWVGREWFGPKAGLFACCLAAWNGPHVYFSRTALTDPVLCLFLTLAVYLTWRLIQRGGVLNLLGAAGCTALAWWTKYNGWLPLAIALAAVPPWLWFRRRTVPWEEGNQAVSRGTESESADRGETSGSLGGRNPGDGIPSVSSIDCSQQALGAGSPHPAGEGVSVKPGLPTGTAAVSRETELEGANALFVSRETVGGEVSSPAVSRETGSGTPRAEVSNDGRGSVAAQSVGGDVRSHSGGSAGASPSREGLGVPSGSSDEHPVGGGISPVSRETGSLTPVSDGLSDGRGSVAAQSAGGDLRMHIGGSAGASPSRGGLGVPSESSDEHPGGGVSRETGSGTSESEMLSDGRRSLAAQSAGGDLRSHSGGSAGASPSRGGLVEAAPPTWLQVMWRLVMYVAIAAAAWSPCLLGLQSVGGYRAVADNHRRYVGQPENVIPTARTQFEALTYLEGSGGRFSVAIAMLCVLLFGRLTGDRFGKWQLGILVGLAVAAIGTGAILIVGLLATAWGATLLVPSNSAGRLPLASWMTAAWLAGLSLATPFYTPYPRLTLPWLVVSWLAAGAFVAQKPIAHAGGRSLRSHQFILGGLTLLLGGLFLSARVQTPIDGKIPSVGMREAAHEVAEVIRGDLELPAGGSLDQAVVYIYGEPALLFQLRLAGVSCHPIQDLGFASGRGPIPAATYVVIGERTTREPHFADQREVADRLRLVQEVIARLPPLVWLDEPWDRPISSESSSQHPYRFEILRLGDRRTPDSLP